MTNIPFPTPHDADALNDYLDGLAAGKQVTPDGEVQATANQFHHLAKAARLVEGPKAMNPMALTAPAAPVSNRTRQQQIARRTSSRGSTWISTALVAALLLSVIGYGIWDSPGRNDNNLAWAPQTASPMAEEPLVWTQPVSYRECPEGAEPNRYDPDNPGGTIYTQEDYDLVSPERSYEIVGPADPADALAIVTRMREAQGCIWAGKSTLNVTARFEYENRTTAGRASVEATAGQQTEGADLVSTWLSSEFGLTPQDLYVYQDPDELTLDGTESVINTALYNPAMAVTFADGRIGILRSIVTYEPFPEEWDIESLEGAGIYMTIFVYQDGEWMLDENLPLCIGDCEMMATPVSTDGEFIYPFSTPAATPEG